jgi:hypothetical protein
MLRMQLQRERRSVEEVLLYPRKLSWIIVYIINVENVATEISKDYGRNVAVPQRAGLNNCLYGKC